MLALLRSFIIAILASLPLPVLADDCPRNDYSPLCEDARAQAVYERVDGELNAAYQALLNSMSKPRNAHLDYPALRAKFIQAQRQWVRFRDDECDAWYLVNQTGTGRNTDKMSCVVERTQDRTRQLKAWSSYLP